MKRAIWIPSVVCALVLIASCGSGGGEVGPSGQAVQRFYGHLNDGDPEAAVELYATDVRAGFLGYDGTVDPSFSTWADGETRQGTIAEVKILDEEVDDEAGTGTVAFELVYAAGASERRKVSMTWEDEQWKLGFIDSGD